MLASDGVLSCQGAILTLPIFAVVLFEMRTWRTRVFLEGELADRQGGSV